MNVAPDSAWSREEIEQFLDRFVAPLRLASTDGAGFPRVCSLWVRRRGDELVCATQSDAWIARALGRNARCGFELAPNEPPYFGIRGRGVARIDPDENAAELGRLIDRYLGDRSSELARWLLSRAEDEVVISIAVDSTTSWDYRDRMEGEAER